MQHLRHHRSAFSWFAFVAILALALAPTVSRWLAAGQGGSTWAQLCMPKGMTQSVSAADADSTSQPMQATAMHLDHCALCGLAAQGMAPPPLVDAPEMVPVLAEQPALLLLAPRPLFAWTAAQPRAPPTA